MRTKRRYKLPLSKSPPQKDIPKQDLTNIDTGLLRINGTIDRAVKEIEEEVVDNFIERHHIGRQVFTFTPENTKTVVIDSQIHSIHKEDKNDKPLVVHNPKSIAKKIEQEVLYPIKARVTKFFKSFAKLLERKQNDYADYLLSDSKDAFPRGWMAKDRQIKINLKRYPKFYPMLNYLFNLYRLGVTDDKINEMNHLVGFGNASELEAFVAKWGNKQLCTFVADKAFYETMAISLDCKVSTCHKYIDAFVEYKIIIRLGRHEEYEKEFVYSDGWYKPTPIEGRLVNVKTAHMKQTTHKKVLRVFQLNYAGKKSQD